MMHFMLYVSLKTNMLYLSQYTECSYGHSRPHMAISTTLGESWSM